MNVEPTSPESSGSTANNGCTSVDDVLKKVIDELNAFEAKNLVELKTELELFIKVKDAAITEYKNKYDDFKNRWCEEGAQIELLRSDLLCGYRDWKELIQAGVCPVRGELHKCEEDIKSLKACKGINERARDEARDELDAAKAIVEAWKTATQKIEDKLKANQDLIKQIQNHSQGQDRAFRFYLLWFKLLPAHNKLRPGDKPVLYPDETPEALCGECKQEGKQAEQSQESYPEAQQLHGKSENTPCGKPPQEAPWIIDKEKYSGKLDCAFADYKLKKEAYAQTVSAFQANSDDLVSVTKKCDDRAKSLEDDVKKALAKAVSDAMTGGKCL